MWGKIDVLQYFRLVHAALASRLPGVPQRRLGETAGHWCGVYEKSIIFSFCFWGCWCFHSLLVLKAGIYSTRRSSTGCRQRILIWSHDLGWERFLWFWWFSWFQRGDICDFWAEKSWITSSPFPCLFCFDLELKSDKILFPKVPHCGLIPAGGMVKACQFSQNCWRIYPYIPTTQGMSFFFSFQYLASGLPPPPKNAPMVERRVPKQWSLLHTVDGWNPKQPPGMYETL